MKKLKAKVKAKPEAQFMPVPPAGIIGYSGTAEDIRAAMAAKRAWRATQK